MSRSTWGRPRASSSSASRARSTGSSARRRAIVRRPDPLDELEELEPLLLHDDLAEQRSEQADLPGEGVSSAGRADPAGLASNGRVRSGWHRRGSLRDGDPSGQDGPAPDECTRPTTVSGGAADGRCSMRVRVAVIGPAASAASVTAIASGSTTQTSSGRGPAPQGQSLRPALSRPPRAPRSGRGARRIGRRRRSGRG